MQTKATKRSAFVPVFRGLSCGTTTVPPSFLLNLIGNLDPRVFESGKHGHREPGKAGRSCPVPDGCRTRAESGVGAEPLAATCKAGPFRRLKQACRGRRSKLNGFDGAAGARARSRARRSGKECLHLI